MKKITEKFNSIYKDICRQWKKGEWRKVAKRVLCDIVLLTLILIAICEIAIILITYSGYIFYLLIGITIIVIWFRWLFPKKITIKEEPPTLPKAEKPIALQHYLVTEFMFNLFQSLSVSLHIISPSIVSEIMDKVKLYTDNATNVTYFRYNVIVNGTAIEAKLFREILRQGIEKGLACSTSKLGRPVFEHGSNYYPKLVIEEVQYTGASWLVVVAIVDNDYAVVLENRAQAQNFSDNQDDFTFYQDRDF
jgi:hypothetical protein